MKIDDIITEAEYNSIKELKYDQFCIYMSRLVKLCVEEALKALPFVLTHLSNQAVYLKEMSDKFYVDNKDLAKHRKIMAQEIEKAEGKNPGKKYEEVVEIAAIEARKIVANMGKVTDFNPKKIERFDSHLGKL